MKFATCLDYEYAQVAVDLFCEHVTLVHCSVVVCNYVSPFFLYLKRVCHNFEIWIHSVVRLDKRDKAYKAQAHCLTYALSGLHEMFHPSVDGDPFTRWSHSREIEALHGRIVVCLSQEQLGYLTKYIIHWNWDLKTS